MRIRLNFVVLQTKSIKMSKNKIIQTVNEIANLAKSKGIAHLNTQDKKLKKNYITLNNKKVINFGSCSYLGLEFETDIKEAAKAAIDNYGTQFSSSRAYLSPIFYQSLEKKLNEIFEGHVMVAPTTTLGHIATIPVIVDKNDAVIMDHQVHNSVQTAVGILKSKNVHIELLRHNRMDLLEQRIQYLRDKHEKIWYMADGIYSMYGDPTPLDDVYALLDTYEKLHFYVDDAHGMSCYGDKGQGYVLSEKKMHQRMIVATSLNKAFASGGGAIIFPDEAQMQLVKNCGGPMITSGPMQPSALGAANAVADIHLSGKIKEYQEQLEDNIRYTSLMLKKHNLLNMAHDKTPIFFIAVSLPIIAHKLIQRLKEDGFFLNLGIFPAVPIKNTGVRFTITRLHTFKQIESMVGRMAFHFKEVLAEENVQLIDIYKAFRIKYNPPVNFVEKLDSRVNKSGLILRAYKSISDISSEKWDKLLGVRNGLDANNLALLEASFSNNQLAHQNWNFDYVIIEDQKGNPVLATFFTETLSKDDMLADKQISYDVEVMREKNPNYMVSKTLYMGSQVTEGNHLYLDKASKEWPQAMKLLFQKINELQQQYGPANTIIRDLDNNDEEMDKVMMNNGFFKMEMPENSRINDMLEWETEEDFYATLSKKKKGHFRRNILRTADSFDVRVEAISDEKMVEKYYDLYLNVKHRSLEINTFALPLSYFKQIAKNEHWEIIALYINDSCEATTNEPVGMGLCYKGMTDYAFPIVGLNYELNKTYNCYRQILWQVVKRANELGYQNINMGFTSTMEKRHFGAKVFSSCAYMQINDNYELEALATMSTTKNREDGVNQRRVLSI